MFTSAPPELAAASRSWSPSKKLLEKPNRVKTNVDVKPPLLKTPKKLGDVGKQHSASKKKLAPAPQKPSVRKATTAVKKIKRNVPSKLAALVFKNRTVKFPRLFSQPKPHQIVFHRTFTPHPKFGKTIVKPVQSTGLTLVTAYFNIGTFTKIKLNTVHNSDLYREWMSQYSKILNPLIVYVDNTVDLKHFENVRKGLPTRVVQLTRSLLWTFTLQNATSRIFKQRG